MRIYVKSPDLRLPISLRLPTALLTSRFAAKIAANSVCRFGVSLSEEQFYRLLKTLRAYRAANPAWTLIEATSADGTHVCITL